ncbi:MAG: RDD family protein [Sphingobacteriales bacterium]|nr:MAG: RDD family protein [Sphingobacteriales bacterium]
MQTVTIHTTQNIGIDYEIAGLGERILALLIDYAIFFVLFIFCAFFVPSFGSEYAWFIIIPIAVLYTFYDLICEMAFNGQSFGKKIMKIRVISLDGARPSFGQYLIRWLFRLVDFGLTGGVGGLICAAVTKNVQRIGDIVAGTTLIKTQPRTQMEHLVFKPSEDNYQPVFHTAAQLSDKDIALISDVINNYYKTGNTVIVYNMADRLKQLLNITPPEKMNDMTFLQTIIKDYSHIVAQADIVH